MSNSQNSTDNVWKSQAGFIWSLIGSAVGFANILSFSAQVYKNGGGAFLIPYCMALFMLGIPLLMLEGIIGYRFKLPLVAAYGQVLGKIGKTLGWIAVFACLSIGGFYIVLTGYSVAYTYFSAVQAIPEDSKTFFLETFLKITPNLTEFGQISIPIFISTIAVSVVTWFVLVRDIKDGIEKICSIFMPLLVVIMTLFAIIVAFLPGGVDGWIYYLKPDFSKLANPSLWRDVFGQLFFSLSLGLGIIVGYSRYTGESINIAKAMRYVALGDLAVSFISGAAIFGCLAHISYTQNIAFDAIVTSDSTFEIGFIVFPHIFKFFGPILAPIIGVIFFFCIFIAGITGVFSIVESIAGNVEIEFKTTRKVAVTATICAMTLIANGYKEVVLTGINIGDFDGNKSEGETADTLADLVRAVDQVPGLKRLRVSSIDPDEVSDDLLDAIIKGKNTCHSMHIVLQAGSNVILKRMNRKYTRQIFMETVDRLRAADPNFTFTTDVIVGFPGETEEDAQETLSVIQEVKFAKVHMFPYSERPRTRAALMPNKVPQETINVRKQQVLRMSEQVSYELHNQFIGQRMTILTERTDPAHPGMIGGHTDNFLMVWIPQADLQSNELIEVDLIENTPSGLIGKAVARIS